LTPDNWATLALGPILWAQGKYVRKTTPLLPEPKGPRQGVLGDGPLLRLLVVGDSAAAGVGAAHQGEALLGQLVANLAHDYQVEYKLIAATGSTTSGTVKRLAKTEATPFDIAVTSMGVNDATRLLPNPIFLNHQSRLMDILQERFQVKHVLVSGLPPMHLFPALPQPLRWVMGRKAKSLDGALEQWLDSVPGCHYLKSDFTMDPDLMAPDGFHPGPEIYRMWGAAMVHHILKLFPHPDS